jgi:UDP-2,3-diacylglucosamine pyrophosphatase LpxH
MIMGKLTDKSIRAAKPQDKRFKMSDGRTIVCHGDMVTTTFNRYKVYLAGKSPVSEMPTRETIARRPRLRNVSSTF